ncbi:MAG: hypothetical protein RLP44_21205 [Aggregatilineales bacterium]
MFKQTLFLVTLLGLLAACDSLTPPQPTATPTFVYSAPTLAPSPSPFIVPLTRAAPGLEDRGVNNAAAAGLPANSQMPPLAVTANPNGVLSQVGRGQIIQITDAGGGLLNGVLHENLIPPPNAVPQEDGTAPQLLRTPGVLIVTEDINGWGDYPQRLRDAGYTVLVVEVLPASTVADFGAILHSLSESNTVDPGLIGVIGAERGADLALLGCALDLLCDTVALLSPSSGETLVNLLPQYGTRPLLVAASRDDPEAFNTASQLQLNARGETRFEEFDSAGSGVEMLASTPELEVTITVWLNRFLVG